jgi:hypothetical protein
MSIDVNVTNDLVIVTETTEDIVVNVSNAAGPQGPAGQGVPVGGTAGQVLKKLSNTNYDTFWTLDGVGVPYTGATGDVNLGAFNLTANSIIKSGGTSSQFLKANGSVDSTTYTPSTRNITINGTTQDLSADRTFSVGTVTSLTLATGTTGTDVNVSNGTITTSGTITLNIPDASATARGLITTGTQTIAGVKTFSSSPTVPSLYLSNMTAGSGALYYNTSENRLTLANYNVGGILMFEVNGGTYAMTLNADLTARFNGYTTNGFVKFSSSNGTLVVDTTTYQPLLTNPVTGTGVAGQVAYWNGTSSQTGSNNLFWDAANSRLGVGTTSPQTNLHVSTAGSVSGRFSNTTSGVNTEIGVISGLGYVGTQSAANFAIITSDTERARFTTAGRLLLGTTTESTFLLDVNGTARVSGALTGNTGSFSSTMNADSYGLAGAVNALAWTLNTLRIGQGTYWNNIELWDGSTIKIKMFSGGNLLLQNGGTFTDAGYRLDVQGTARVSGEMTVNGIASLGTSQTTTLAYIGDFNTVGTRYIRFSRASALSNIVNIQGVNGGVGADNISLQAEGGNVGIGTSSPAAKLHVDDGAGAALYIGLGTYNYYRAFEHIWQSLNGTFQRMSISSAGNLLVNTNVDAGFKLDINGTARVTGAATFSSSVTATSFIKSGGTSSQYLMADGSVTTGGGGGVDELQVALLSQVYG